MRFLKYIFILSIFISSCKSNKKLIDANAIVKNSSSKKIAKKHKAVSFDKQTIDAKLKVNFNNGTTNQNLSVHMKMIKDKVIWLRGSKFITIFKAEITPTHFKYYSPLFKNYFEGDFSMIKEVLGVDLNFDQLQNLFLGQTIKDITKQKLSIELSKNTYILSPEKQDSFYNIFYTINPAHFKLDEQRIENKEKQLGLTIKYPNYKLSNAVIYPTAIEINAKDKETNTALKLEYKFIEFDVPVKMSFNIPNGYKRFEF